jgi:hypothetical protein
MRQLTRTLACGLLLGSVALGSPDDSNGIWVDPAGDAGFRLTDEGADGLLPPGIDPIDLLGVVVTGWTTPTPLTDPYNGFIDEGVDLMRIEISFSGLISPPGPLGIGEVGGQYDPLEFGDRPVYGTIELDIDDDKDSGGELGDLALVRYLANVGRFGRTPEGSISDRVATGAGDYDGNYWLGRQYERTGAEFAFVMCGCWEPEVISEGGDGNGFFDAGESWIVRGRFFERIQSVAPVSGLFGGSTFGNFDPQVDVRWSHNILTDETTVELVFPLTMAGAAMLTGQPEQPLNLSLFDHTSVAEAISDLIESADFATNELEDLIDQWRGEKIDDYLEPKEWEVSALIGTAYAAQEIDARYVWTDTGFHEVLGDVDGDELADSNDRAVVDAFIAGLDGGVNDCDGSINGSVMLCQFARNFSLYDFNNDGLVDACDSSTLGLGADVNGDGLVDFFDVSMFLGWFSAQDPRADLNGDGLFEFFDILAYLQRFSNGCP